MHPIRKAMIEAKKEYSGSLVCSFCWSELTCDEIDKYGWLCTKCNNKMLAEEKKLKRFRASCIHGTGEYETLDEAIEVVNSHNASCWRDIPIIEIKSGKVVYTSSGITAQVEHSRWLEQAYGTNKKLR